MRPRKQPSKQATLDDVLQAVVTLCRHVDALDRNVQRLAGRIQPYDNEQDPKGHPWPTGLFDQKLVATSENILKIVRHADRHLKDAEGYLALIKARIDQISNDSWSREDFKPHLDQDGPRRKTD